MLALSKRIEQGDDPYLKEVAEENCVGYLAQIHARVNTAGVGDIQFLQAPMTSIESDQLRTHLALLLKASEVEVDSLSIHVDLSDVLCTDETLLTGAYLAVRSAIDDRAIRADAIIACGLSPNKRVLGVPSLNQRLMTTVGQVPSVYVFEDDHRNKLDEGFYSTLAAVAGARPIEINSVLTLEALYTEVTEHGPILSDSRSHAEQREVDAQA